jgi:hypothetical protein
VSTRVTTLAAVGLLLACWVGCVGCGGAKPATEPAPRLGEPERARTGELCTGYASVARGARTPLDAMRAGPVLSPFVALIELAPRQVAEQGKAATDPAVAGALAELAGALDELDAQGRAALPPGADLTKTPVRLDPTRLAAALDGADRACAAYPAR